MNKSKSSINIFITFLQIAFGKGLVGKEIFLKIKTNCPEWFDKTVFQGNSGLSRIKREEVIKNAVYGLDFGE